jgi:hypothetical protein
MWKFSVRRKIMGDARAKTAVSSTQENAFIVLAAEALADKSRTIAVSSMAGPSSAPGRPPGTRQRWNVHPRMPLRQGPLAAVSAVGPEVQRARKPMGHRLTHSAGLELARGNALLLRSASLRKAATRICFPERP